MNENNLDYLSKQLRYTGFGDWLVPNLRDRMQRGEASFSLPHVPEFANDHAAATLHFKKSETQDNWFFNRYSLHVVTPIYPEAIKQTFYINAGQDNISLKEAYNLLMGRAVFKTMTPKEGEKYPAWVQLDFKNTEINGNYKIRQFNEHYGFQLDQELAKWPIKEMLDTSSREQIKSSLERGNRQLITLSANGKDQKLMIEAAPQYKTLNFYDEHGKKLHVSQIEKQLQPSTAKEQRTPAGDKPQPDPGEDEKPTRKKRKGQSL